MREEVFIGTRCGSQPFQEFFGKKDRLAKDGLTPRRFPFPSLSPGRRASPAAKPRRTGTGRPALLCGNVPASRRRKADGKRVPPALQQKKEGSVSLRTLQKSGGAGQN